MKRAVLFDGGVAISAILIVGFFVLEIVILGLVTSYLSSERGLGKLRAYQAYYAAESGIHEGILRVERGTHSLTDAPVIDLGNNITSEFSIQEISANQVVVTATGRALTKQKTLTARIALDTVSGVARVIDMR